MSVKKYANKKEKPGVFTADIFKSNIEVATICLRCILFEIGRSKALLISN